MRIKPDFNLNSIFDIKEEELLARGIKCVFFDLDSTVMQSKTGKFTEETLEFLNRLSKNFKIPKTSIKILKGETSKDKTILFKTSDTEKVKLLNNTFS